MNDVGNLESICYTLQTLDPQAFVKNNASILITTWNLKIETSMILDEEISLQADSDD